MKLLLVEDDEMLGDSMQKGLRLAGFTVDHLMLGAHALNAMSDQAYDVIVLDLGLPDMDGLEVLERVRRRGLSTPMILVTARSAVRDRIDGLNLGADDYLAKPFDLDELVARIHALGRRGKGQAQATIELGRLHVNPIERTARLDGQDLKLSPREYDLLVALARQPGAVLSPVQLRNQLYGLADDVSSNTVEVHLHFLRKKLGGPWIVNVRGVGYKLVKPE